VRGAVRPRAEVPRTSRAGGPMILKRRTDSVLWHRGCRSDRAEASPRRPDDRTDPAAHPILCMIWPARPSDEAARGSGPRPSGAAHKPPGPWIWSGVGISASSNSTKVLLPGDPESPERPLAPALSRRERGKNHGSGDASSGPPRCQGRQSAATAAARAGSVARRSAAIRQAWRTVAGSRPPK
jgi:hypothetical protein